LYGLAPSFVLKGHCITTHRNAVGQNLNNIVALKGQWSEVSMFFFALPLQGDELV
jgi:hypothetical protein